MVTSIVYTHSPNHEDSVKAKVYTAGSIRAYMTVYVQYTPTTQLLNETSFQNKCSQLRVVHSKEIPRIAASTEPVYMHTYSTCTHKLHLYMMYCILYVRRLVFFFIMKVQDDV